MPQDGASSCQEIAQDLRVPSSSTSNECVGNSGVVKLNCEEEQTLDDSGGISRPEQGWSTQQQQPVITIDDGSPLRFQQTGGHSLLSTYPDSLVCDKCTFDNGARAEAGLPVPSACAVCFSPLRDCDAGGLRKDLKLQASSPGTAASDKIRPQLRAPDPDPDHFQEPSPPKGTEVVHAADLLLAEGMEQEFSVGAVRAEQCPMCTVVVPSPRATVCHVCDAPITAPARNADEIDLQCSACTLRNDDGAVDCRACGAALNAGGELASIVQALADDHVGVPQFVTEDAAAEAKRAGVLPTGIVVTIPTRDELKSRTLLEGADSQATTPSLIPRIHKRLQEEYNTTGRSSEDESGRRRLDIAGAGARGMAGGRGGLDWCVSGKKRIQAEWRLCDPRTVHCTQRGSRGSGFSCGYRNIQMLCSALMEWPEYRRLLFGGSGCIPGISLLQCWIERAWADGYDPDGCEQLGGPGALMGSEIWIGATECAAVLRSFGVKAEVIDFETDVSVQAFSTREKGTQESDPRRSRTVQNAKKRKTPPDSPPSRAKRSNHHRLHKELPSDPTQQSIRSYLPPSSKSVPEGRPPTNSRDKPARSTLLNNSDVIGALLAGRPEKTPDKDTARAEGQRSENGQEEDTNGSVVRGGGEPCVSRLRVEADGADALSLTGQAHRKNGIPDRHLGGHSSRPVAPVSAVDGTDSRGRCLPIGAGRGSRRGGGRNAGGIRRGGRGKTWDEGNRMGRAIAEWAWAYFCSSWGGEEFSRGNTDGLIAGGCASGYLDALQSSQTDARTGGSVDAFSAEGECHAKSVSASKEAATTGMMSADMITRERPDAGKVSAVETDASSPTEDANRMRRPPPLYFQHDGHSRSVVGVLWPQGRGDARCLDERIADAGERKAGGSEGRSSAAAAAAAGGRQPASLLVFDPSHPGWEIRNALDDRRKLRWNSFIKRGEHTLRRRQFQMVAIRPGVIEREQAHVWKRIVSTKVCVR